MFNLRLESPLKTAWIYWAVHPEQLETLGDALEGTSKQECPPEFIEDVGGALNGASKLLRRRLGEGLKLRYTPNLHFKHDDSLARGLRIDHLLNQL